MKKHLIAAAVAAAVAAPAMAQNVTISGTLDMSAYAASKLTSGNPTTAEVKAKATSVENTWTTSVLNMAGTEDLGGGLKASFFFNSAVGNGFAARDRYVQLDGGFGSFRFGRYEATTTAMGAFVSASGSTNAGGTFESPTGDLQDGTVGNGSGYSFGRNDGLIRYVSPKIGDVTITAEYRLRSLDNAALTAGSTLNTGKIQQDQKGLRVDYAAGPLAVAVSFSQLDTDRETIVGVGARADKDTLRWIGATYDFGPAKLNFAHAQRKDKQGAIADSAAPPIAAVAARTISDIKVSTVGIAVPVGALTLSASLYDGKDDGGVGVADDLDLKGYQLAARYALSKRTAAYAVMSQSKEDNQAPAGAAAYFKATGYAVGLVHSF